MNTLTLDQVQAWDGPPLVLFIGVRTGGSLIHRVFPAWAAVLGRRWTLRGVDLAPETSAQRYRRLVTAISDNPAIQGAVVTVHKLRLYRACAGDLGRRDHLADLTHEVNTLTAADGAVSGYARDPLSLTQILPSMPNILCLGAGGAATALLVALHQRTAGGHPPASTVFADRDPRALDDLQAVAIRLGIDPAQLLLVPVGDPQDCDQLVADMPRPALIINATGMGKDAPGSPVTDQAPFDPATLAWDFNYRGPLTFLEQAAVRGARTMDGWDYFVAGWAGGLTAIAGTPFDNDLCSHFGQAAAPYRPRRAS
jgi:shikimate 5-dehydrogenase